MTAWEYGYLHSIITRGPSRRPGEATYSPPENGPTIFIAIEASGPYLLEGCNDDWLKAFNTVGRDGWLVDRATGSRVYARGPVADIAMSVDGVAEILHDQCVRFHMRREAPPT